MAESRLRLKISLCVGWMGEMMGRHVQQAVVGSVGHSIHRFLSSIYREVPRLISGFYATLHILQAGLG